VLITPLPWSEVRTPATVPFRVLLLVLVMRWELTLAMAHVLNCLNLTDPIPNYGNDAVRIISKVLEYD
jgi:hypothetical protein